MRVLKQAHDGGDRHLALVAPAFGLVRVLKRMLLPLLLAEAPVAPAFGLVRVLKLVAADRVAFRLVSHRPSGWCVC